MAPRIAEAQRRWDDRAELRARAEQAARPKLPPAGVLLLSRNAALIAQVAAFLEDLQPVRSAPPVMTAFKEDLEAPPLLLLLDLVGADGEERHRIRSLLEAQPPGCPILVLGKDGRPDAWQPLAAELKARLYLKWDPSQAAFFRRVVQGVIERHWRQVG